jgi:hypothetical protein
MPGTYALLLLNVKQVTSEAPIKLWYSMKRLIIDAIWL